MKLIILLMSFASLGLIGFQYYWVSNALRINEQRFEQNVYQSLSSAISQMENNETSDMFLSILYTDTTLQKSLFQKIEPIEVQVRQRPVSNRRRPSVMDSMMKQPMPQVSQRFKRLVEAQGVDLDAFTSLDNFFTYLTADIAGKIFTPDEMEILLQERERQLQYLSQTEAYFRNRQSSNEPDFVEEYNIPKDAFEKIRYTNLKIEAMNQVMQELLEGQKDILTRVDTSQVKKLVQNHLKERGISQKFDLAILNDKDELIPISWTKDSVSLKTQGVQARLFPTDFLGKENHLIINFPDKRTYILQQIWLPVLSSVMFIGIVIFCFIYAITVIIRQKNLSDIKNDFINNMTHEFKTPIATVSLAIEALQDPELMSQDSFRKRYLGIIKDENKRLGTQVEKVLQAATLDKKEFKLKMEQLNLEEVLNSAKEHIELQVESKEGKITLDSKLKEPIIEADAFHLTHIINNLLDNAIKYTKDKPVIHLKSWDQNGSVFVSIEDNGIGMTKDAVKKIFDKFYRVPTGNVHDVKGFGLGLSYVKTMLEAHKGEISVESDFGKGSIFTIKLPKKQ
ncbi:sensor histidine kinase [Arthrospiribacter ruber]|uniref:histidine kinase n=1 Tax=Arthrospiribacter ruber TaxID=2487934 RepID=A0A951IXA4_9BACT|nr:HAMP domain-containing sensor histidine kinase [Arthrospiribacter ruber]MBW3467566.1 sensor histidine kinase [Arthrospiribacter ruber]